MAYLRNFPQSDLCPFFELLFESEHNFRCSLVSFSGFVCVPFPFVFVDFISPLPFYVHGYKDHTNFRQSIATVGVRSIHVRASNECMLCLFVFILFTRLIFMIRIMFTSIVHRRWLRLYFFFISLLLPSSPSTGIFSFI